MKMTEQHNQTTVGVIKAATNTGYIRIREAIKFASLYFLFFLFYVQI